MKSPAPLGVALLEALVALCVLAFAVMGLLAYQLRSYVDGQLAAQRVVANRLAQDLFERVRANPGGTSLLPNYATANQSGGRPSDCAVQPCTGTELVAWDLDQWRSRVGRELPMGQATVFLSQARSGQLGILLSWRANEDATQADVLRGLMISAQTSAGTLNCPDRRICHLLFSAP
ncbi:MAG: type IV pilus modification protein PilV [Curvibacter sp.]|nr:type IV pilus modification protein PilV [Curvibacter sp.]